MDVNEYSGNIHRAVDDRFHDIMMHLSKSKGSSTQTTYDKNEEPIESSPETSETETSVKTNLRTLVPSVTQTTLTSSSTETSKPISYSTDTQTQIVSTKSEQSLDNQGSSTELDKQTSHSTTQSSKEEPESNINLAYEEQNEISRVIESQSPHQVLEKPQSTETCIQECSENEICKVFRQEHVCICKPGYSRRSPTQDCRKAESYEVSIVLEKLSDSTLSFSSELKNKSHPNTQFLMKEINSGIEKAMMNSDLSDKYYSNVILDFDRVKEEEENHSNYSLGGGAVYARKEPSSILAATDFDECSFEEHNDCHENALCINLVGTFKCECKEGFQDLFAEEELKTGRQCVQSKTCSFCNYNGRCQISLSEDSEGTTCICNDWFSGKNCDINLKVISVGSFLLLLFCIFAAFCCCRKKKQSQRGLLGSSSHGKLSTLDRRAMIHDTSSESSEDFTRHRSGTIVD
ncbi:Transmembrane matrix receptor MUP-4 [Armadillidium nasatum]|uniref:Transmembrane matrix receptor MUP-4 n=1 Tax=Armadillidium nasatum TaxID=96803 RepID=A0A5N5SMG9_9CRUS|nr:Transmembrane matrix receptor MUP-4 [Armadillidium nasatum]